MPTPFLKDRYGTFFGEVAGLTTVSYYAFTEGGGIDELTGDIVDESQAYSGTSVSLSALITFNPSQAVREKIGLEIEFDSLVRLSQQQLAEKSVTVKIGDAFVLPGDSQWHYTKKVVLGKQAEDGFLDLIVAVKRGVGRRG